MTLFRLIGLCHRNGRLNECGNLSYVCRSGSGRSLSVLRPHRVEGKYISFCIWLFEFCRKDGRRGLVEMGIERQGEDWGEGWGRIG